MLAEAPIGVQLPPRVAPDKRPKNIGMRAASPNCPDIPAIIGIIVAVAGIYVEPVTNFFRRFRKPKDNGRRRY